MFRNKICSCKDSTKLLNILCLTDKVRCITPIFEEIYSAYHHVSMENSAFLGLEKVRTVCCPLLFSLT